MGTLSGEHIGPLEEQPQIAGDLTLTLTTHSLWM